MNQVQLQWLDYLVEFKGKENDESLVSNIEISFSHTFFKYHVLEIAFLRAF